MKKQHLKYREGLGLGVVILMVPAAQLLVWHLLWVWLMIVEIFEAPTSKAATYQKVRELNEIFRKKTDRQSVGN